MNLPNKVKIIKEHEGFPPVGTVMKLEGLCYSYPITKSATVNLASCMISLALEAGYAEEVKEQWQAWKREEKRSYYFIYVNVDLSIGEAIEDRNIVDECRFEAGNYFDNRRSAIEARDRILETLKEFHKEHNTQ
jgi:hypothetical protein